MADGITPGKVDQAYVLRRLIRRMIREARKLGVNGLFTAKLAEVVIRGYKEFYPELEAAYHRKLLGALSKPPANWQAFISETANEMRDLAAKLAARK